LAPRADRERPRIGVHALPPAGAALRRPRRLVITLRGTMRGGTVR